MCNEIVGVNGDEGTPVPIPNTVVKLVYGDNTWLATAREDNSTPTSKAATKVAAFSFFCRDFAGYMSCVSNTSCLGGSLFCSGLLVDLTAQAIHSIRAESFSLRFSGEFAVPRQWARG